VAIEVTQAIGDADPGAKDESYALIEHGAGEAERCHRVLRWMLDEHLYLACQLSMFYCHATEGYPKVTSL
jgi:cobalamin biosynthesis Co2+ chelatase CbiK